MHSSACSGRAPPQERRGATHLIRRTSGACGEPSPGTASARSHGARPPHSQPPGLSGLGPPFRLPFRQFRARFQGRFSFLLLPHDGSVPLPPLQRPCCELSRGSSCPERRLLGNTAYLTRVATVTAPHARSLAMPCQPLSVRPRRFPHLLALPPAAGYRRPPSP